MVFQIDVRPSLFIVFFVTIAGSSNEGYFSMRTSIQCGHSGCPFAMLLQCLSESGYLDNPHMEKGLV
jgi:hypothetical protein